MKRAPFVGRVTVGTIAPLHVRHAYCGRQRLTAAEYRGFRAHRLRLAYAALERMRARGEL